jgi:hypothetical protein
MGSYVALSELKSALGITSSTDDAFLTLAIGAAETAINDLCGRKFTADGAASARTYRAQPYICVSDDISTLTGLVVKTDTNADGTFDQTWASTDIQVEPLNNLLKTPARSVNNLRAVGDYTFPVYGDGRASVEVTAKWGWPAVPDPIEQATLMMASRLYGRKASPMGVIGVGDFGPVRISRSDPDVAHMLMDYRRAGIA